MNLNIINSNNLIPTRFYLAQNYPNPFKEKTSIKFCVAYKTNVSLEVFDDEGNILIQLFNEEKEPGTYEVEFSVKDVIKSEENVSNYQTDKNKNLTSETFNYKLRAGNFTATKKLLLLK